jgi:hypothetical protein
MLGSCWVAAQLAACQEWLSSVELVNRICLKCLWKVVRGLWQFRHFPTRRLPPSVDHYVDSDARRAMWELSVHCYLKSVRINVHAACRLPNNLGWHSSTVPLCSVTLTYVAPYGLTSDLYPRTLLTRPLLNALNWMVENFISMNLYSELCLLGYNDM